MKKLPLACLLAIVTASVPAGAADVVDHWNLGSLGATADLVDARMVIVRVMPDRPAHGKLKKGDVILGANGVPFEKDPFDALGRALDLAEKEGEVALTVERGGKETTIELKLPKLGSYAAGGFIAKNKKIKKHVKTACEFLVSEQQSGGLWHKYRDGQKHRGDGITTATVISALGLMASDPKKYKKAIKSARGFVMAEVRPSALGPDATTGLHRNWPVALTCLFLAEYYGQTGDKTVRGRLQDMLDLLAGNQEPTGGWSHFPAFEEPGYKSLSSLTALALIAQGVSLRVGMKVDPKSITKGLDYLEGCIGEERGDLAYSAVNPATGVQCTGRACGAVVAFHMHNRTSKAIKKLRQYVIYRYGDLLESHPAPLTGVLFATMLAGAWRGSADPDTGAFKGNLTRLLVPFITLARHPAGYFVAQPTSETREVAKAQNKANADREVHDPYWATGILLMLHGTTSPRLVCLGGKPKKKR